MTTRFGTRKMEFPFTELGTPVRGAKLQLSLGLKCELPRNTQLEMLIRQLLSTQVSTSEALSWRENMGVIQ